MADNNTDVDIKIRLKSELDNSGIEAAKQALSDLNSGTAVPGPGTPTTSADPTPTAAVDAQTSAVEDLGEAVQDTADQQSTAHKESVSQYRTQTEAVETLTRRLDEMDQARQDATDKQSEGVQQLTGAQADLTAQVDDLNTSQSGMATATVAGNRSVLESIQWLQSGWAKYAQIVSGVFGAIGLVTQAYTALKSIYESYNKTAIEAEARRKTALEEQAAKVKELTQAHIDAAREQRIQEADTLRQYHAGNKTNRYQAEMQQIDQLNDKLIAHAKLKSALDNNQAERTRIALAEADYRGRATKYDIARHEVDRNFDVRANQRGESLAAAQSAYDKAWSQEDNIGRKLVDEQSNLSSIKEDPRYMSRKEYNASLALNKQADTLIKGDGKTSTGLQGQWEDTTKEIEDVQQKIALLQRERIAVPKSFLENLEAAQKQASDVWNKIQAAEKTKETETKKTTDFERLVADEATEGDVYSLWKTVTDSEKNIQALAAELKTAEEEKIKTKQAIDDLKQIQSGERENDNQERKNQQQRINEDERKAAAEANNTAIAALRTEAEQLPAAIAAATAQIKEFRKSLAPQAEEFKSKGAWVGKVQDIATKDKATSEDELYLSNLKSKLAANSNGEDPAGRKRMITLIDQILESIAKERKINEEGNRRLLAKRKQAEGLEVKGQFDGMRNDITDVQARVAAQIRANQAAGKQDDRGGLAAGTISDMRQALADNKVDKSESAELNGLLKQWVADSKDNGADDVNTAMIAALREVLAANKTLRATQAQQGETIKEMMSRQANRL